MRKFTLLLFTVLAFIGLNAQENLVLNGGFEDWKADETPENWIGVKTNIDSTDILKSDDAYAGSHSVNLIRTSSSHKRFTTDTLEVKTGISYQISFMVKGSGEIRSALYDSENWIYNSYVPVTAEWSLVKQVVTAKASSTAAEFILSLRETEVDGLFVDSVVVIELKNAAEIIDFVLADQIAPAMISSENAQVTATVFAGTDLTSLAPEITISEGAQVTPTTGTTVDFTNDVTYMVTAEDGTEKTWNVTVLIAQPIEVSIYDIQFTEDASGDSPYADSLVNTTGIVTGFNDNGFFIQDGDGAWNGIWVYTGGDNTVAVGDEVNVEGLVEEYYNLTEINRPYLVEVLSSGNDLPAAAVVALADFNEPYEGVLVKVENVECSVEANEYGEWNISDGSNEIVVDDAMYALTPAVGDEFDAITGCVTFNFGAYKLLPRDANDVDIADAISEDILSVVNVYPNPFKDQLIIENLGDVKELRITNVIGQQVFAKAIDGDREAINSSEFKSGIYLITIVSDNNDVRVEKLIKE